MITLKNRLEKIQVWSADPNAYTCLQPGLHYFDHSSGFLTYRKALAGHVVLGDPVAAPENMPELLSAYLQKAPNSVFGYVSDTAAQALLQASNKPMRFVRIGFERCISLPYQEAYTDIVRGALKKAAKANLRVTECKLTDLQPEEVTHFQAINSQFLKASPAGKEVGFISRAMHFTDEPDVRFFSISIAAEPLPIGFCVLDPWYMHGKLERYQLHQFRIKQTKLWGVYFSVVALLMEKLQAEGVKSLSLGACAVVNQLERQELPSSRTYEYCRNTTFRLAEYYHPLKNLSNNKLAFAGMNINRYLAAPHKLPLLPLLRFARANNMRFIPKW